MPSHTEIERRKKRIGSFITPSLTENPTSEKIKKPQTVAKRNREIRARERQVAGVQTKPTDRQNRLKRFLAFLGVKF